MIQGLNVVGLRRAGMPPPVREDIKHAYKNLVKVHHPDVNGGDRSSEEKLRTIIAAYSHLKKMGFVAK